ncbi:DUF2142 domain-containing protein [Microbacterium sp. NPDC076911]|uniref:phospholipid carrier-dependent glycosyltransferase n=1 Tax=Microbacterium sp. NPDC076911 TaxID=3154958 RepID=UPI003416630F
MIRRATDAPERRYRAAVALLTLLASLIGIAWAMTLPYFDGPDESRHYNSIARVVDGGGWPRPYDAVVLGVTRQALSEAGVATDSPAVLPLASDRSHFLGDSAHLASGRDAMVQHPPGYYLAAALVVSALGGGELRWDQALMIMRVGSALVLAAAVPFIAGTARWATRARIAGVIGAIGVLAIPSFLIGGGYASNDVLLILACSATIYLLVRACSQEHPSEWLLPLAGLAYGVALFSKGLAMMLAPAVLILALVALHRRGYSPRSVATQLVVPLLIATTIGGWWWIRNLIILGLLQPSQYGSREGSDLASEGYDLAFFVTSFFERLNSTFWGRGTNAETAFPFWVLLGLAAVLIVIIAAALVGGQRRWLLTVLMSYPAIIGTTLLVNAHGIYWDLGLPSRGVQARYLFSGAAVFAAVFATFANLVANKGKMLPRGAVAALAFLPLVSSAAAMLWILPPTWAPLVDEYGVTVADFMGVSGWVYALTGVFAILATLGLAALLFQAVQRPSMEAGRVRTP